MVDEGLIRLERNYFHVKMCVYKYTHLPLRNFLRRTVMKKTILTISLVFVFSYSMVQAELYLTVEGEMFDELSLMTFNDFVLIEVNSDGYEELGINSATLWIDDPSWQRGLWTGENHYCLPDLTGTLGNEWMDALTWEISWSHEIAMAGPYKISDFWYMSNGISWGDFYIRLQDTTQEVDNIKMFQTPEPACFLFLGAGWVLLRRKKSPLFQ